jgi:flagellar basal body-associated protein FliL
MLDEGNDINPETPETPEAPPPEESGNHTFVIVGGILGALIFLTLLVGAAYVIWLGPRLTAQRNAAQSTIKAENAQIAQQMTSTAEAALWTSTLLPTFTPSPTQTVAPKTPTVNPTPVVAAVISTKTPTADPATLAAMQTQLSQQMTSTSVALGTRAIGGEGMPATGFFDQVGLPGLIILTLALVVIIFLARRLRKASSK